MSDISISAQGNLSIGEFVGRDKVVNNIQNIQHIVQQQVLSATEEAKLGRELEFKQLAEGIQNFMARLRARAEEGGKAETGNPYKGLMEYKLADAEIFFGRKQAIQHVVERLTRGHLTILHSESGAGKSSLLQAGIIPRLLTSGHLPVYVRPYNAHPSLAIKHAFLADLKATPELEKISLRDFLHKVTRVVGVQTTLFIFLDQFEEFFTLLTPEAQQPFVAELAQCLNDPTLNVRWLIGLRTDAFGNLANFRPAIRNPFENDYRLNRLTRAEAQEVVIDPAKKRAVKYEEGLGGQILNDLGGETINPPELQLVCSALYDGLAADAHTITRVQYEANQGARGILQAHLDKVLRNLGGTQRPIAQWVLEELISSENRRVLRPFAELLDSLAPRGVTAEALHSVLEYMHTNHLVRADEALGDEPEKIELAPGMDPHHLAYELAHDYLLNKIAVDPAVRARKAAQEMLATELKYHQAHPNTYLGGDKLAIILTRRDELVLNAEAKTFLEESERRFRRQQNIYKFGVSAIIVLAIGAVIAVTVMLGAIQQQRSAEVAAAQAATQAANSELAEVSSRALQVVAEATAQAAATQAAQQQAAAAAAQAEAALAEARAAEAKAVLSGLFENNQLIPVGEYPSALITVDEHLWVSDQKRDLIQIIEPTLGEVLAGVDVGRRPTALVFDGAVVWVALQDDKTLQAIDTQTLTVTKTIQLPHGPRAMVFADGLLWLALTNDTVTWVDPETGDIGKGLQTCKFPWTMVYGDGLVWVGCRNESTIQAINPTEKVIEKTYKGSTASFNGTPAGLVYDGNVLWVTVQDRKQIVPLDPLTGLRARAALEVGVRPTNILYDGTRLIWFTNQGDNTVQAFDRLLGTLSAPFSTGSLPSALALVGGRVWVANASDNTVQAINPSVGNLSTVVKTITTPRGMVVVGQTLWVAGGGEGTLNGVDSRTRVISPTLALGRDTRDVAFDGERLWAVTNRDATIHAFALTNGTATELFTATVNAGPRSVIYAAGYIWVVNNFSNTVQALNPTDGAIVKTIDLGANASPFDLAFDGEKVWVINNGLNNIQAIVPESWELSVPIHVGSEGSKPGSIGFDGTRLWVTNFGDGTVQAIDPQTGLTDEPVRVGIQPVDLVFDGTWLWVANFGENSLQAVDPETAMPQPALSVCAGPNGLAYDTKNKLLWISCRDEAGVQSLNLAR